MPLKIILTKKAQKELDCILDYLLENWGESAVDNFKIVLEDLFRKISIFPTIGIKIMINDIEIRTIPIDDKNVLIYHIAKSKIKVIKIFDVRQHPDKRYKNIQQP